MRLQRLLRVGPGGWRDLCLAQLAVGRAQWAVRRSATGSLTRVVARHERGESRPEPARDSPDRPRSASPTQRARAEALAWALGVVTRRGPVRAMCLARSLALADLLRRANLPPALLRVGVREHEGRAEAHAWVEWDGAILGDDPNDVATYRSFDELAVRVPSGPRSRLSPDDIVAAPLPGNAAPATGP